MQLFAETYSGEVIYAQQALKQHDYYCMECREIVRIRSGEQRQPHFYHLRLSADCRQSQKSMEHLQVQLHIHEILPKGDCILEKRFPEIQRIADVHWVSEKLVFEVQVSPITALEVLARNQAYHRAGCEVVWILHNIRFHKGRVTAAEAILKERPHYYTDIKASGEGCVFDPFDLIHRARRVKKSFRVEVDLSQPLRKRDYLIPDSLQHRLQWPVTFVGDLVNRSEQHGNIQVVSLELPAEVKMSLWKRVISFLRSVYLGVFNILLERASR